MIENNYSITQNMMYMEGFYDRSASACTLVKETERMFVVEKSPTELLEFSIKGVGFNLKGALETSKEAHGDKHFRPLVVNPLINLVVFPTKSVKKVETMWFNPEQIRHTSRTKYLHKKTAIIFKNGEIINIDSKLSSYNDKLVTADQYRKMKIEEAKKTFYFTVDPKNKPFLLLILAYQLFTGDFGFDFPG